MDMLVNTLQAQVEAEVVIDSAATDEITPTNLKELAAGLRGMTYNTTLAFRGWKMQMGGRCNAKREGCLPFQTNKVWVNDRFGNTHKVAGLDEHAAREIARIIGMSDSSDT